MPWQDQLKGDALAWLLEPADPGVRYLALRDLLGRSADDPELRAARSAAHTQGPIAAVLDAMRPEGYWDQPGWNYLPKYRGIMWSLLLLAQLGASPAEDGRIPVACEYALTRALAAGGQVTAGGGPSSTGDCIQGETLFALVTLGGADPRLDIAYEWMARTVTGEGLAPATERDAPLRYYAGKCGPLFACGSNNKLPCAWGGVKVLLACGVWPAARRTPLVARAIAQGVDFFLSIDPATGAYPCGYAPKPSGNWWKFGFPVFYVSDILQVVEALAGLGYGADPRLANALALIRDKQDANGRWALEYDYAGKTWADFGPKKQPNKWVTLRALRALKACGEAASAG